MTPADFDRLAARTRLGPRAAEAARLHLVDGLRLAEVARRTGLAGPTVSAAAGRITRELLAEAGLPPDWQVVTLTLPAESVPAARAIERRALRATGRRI